MQMQVQVGEEVDIEPLQYFSPKKRRNGHTRPQAPLIDIQKPGRLRVAHLLALLGISHSTLYARIRTGVIPKQDGVDGRIPYWNTSTVLKLLRGDPGT